MALEEVLLGPRRYTRTEVAEAARLDPAETRRLWRSLGFADVGDDAVRFTDRDVEAARLVAGLGEAGIIGPDVREAVARATAQSLSQLAEWQVGMLRQVVEARGGELTPQESLEVAGALLPALEQMLSYVWRRHLAATVARMLVTAGPERLTTHDEHAGIAPDTAELAVGFADMVGFTRATRRRSVAELSEMIERFGAVTTEVIAGGHGRIVKTIGDEVLFVADDVAAGAEIALGLRDRVRSEPVLPQLRIGLAAGPVLVRYGDVYGEVVNIAARLTSTAHPDTILVDREIADALAVDPRFALRGVKPVAVRGYRRLHPWVLERA